MAAEAAGRFVGGHGPAAVRDLAVWWELTLADAEQTRAMPA